MREQPHQNGLLGPHMVLQHQNWAERVHRALCCPLCHNCEINGPALLQNVAGTIAPIKSALKPLHLPSGGPAAVNGKNGSW